MYKKTLEVMPNCTISLQTVSIMKPQQYWTIVRNVDKGLHYILHIWEQRTIKKTENQILKWPETAKANHVIMMNDCEQQSVSNIDKLLHNIICRWKHINNNLNWMNKLLNQTNDRNLIKLTPMQSITRHTKATYSKTTSYVEEQNIIINRPFNQTIK